MKLKSLVLEKHTNCADNSGTGIIDQLYYLQHYEEGWRDGKWEERWDVRPCIQAHELVELIWEEK